MLIIYIGIKCFDENIVLTSNELREDQQPRILVDAATVVPRVSDWLLA